MQELKNQSVTMTSSLLLSSGVPPSHLAGHRITKNQFQAFKPCSAPRGGITLFHTLFQQGYQQVPKMHPTRSSPCPGHSTASAGTRGEAQVADADIIEEHGGAMCRRSLLAGVSSLALCAACMPASAGLHDASHHKSALFHSPANSATV